MMDTQRLIALVVFSFSALLLWDAWQKHDAPKVAHPAATTIPAAPSSTPATPATTSSTPSPTAPTPQSAAPQMPTASPAVPVGEPVLVHTDLYDAVISPVGGDIQKLTLQQVHSALDRAKPLTLMEPAPEH
jgi:YidC/Oxa1 family membrane protein insertase